MAKNNRTAQPQAEPPADPSRKPVHTIRYGAVEAAIWKNDGEAGAFYNVTLRRGWRDEQGTWHDSTSFNFKDLPNLAKAITDSHSWIAWQQRQTEQKPKGGRQ